MRKQIYTTYLVALLGIFLTSFLSYKFYEKETSIITTLFNEEMHDKIDALNTEINNKIEILQTIRNLYLSSEVVTSVEFNYFTKMILDRNKDIKALQWIPRVLHKNRKTAEKQWQERYPTFEITQRLKNGTMVRANDAREYYPFYYISPLEGNETVFGFDLNSDKQQLEMLGLSRDSGKVFAVSTNMLTSEQKTYLWLIPVYKEPSSTVAKRRENILGFISGILSINDLAYSVFKNIGENHANIKIIDNTNNLSEVIYIFKPKKFKALEYEYGFEKDLLHFGDKKWSIKATPTTYYYQNKRTFFSYIILIMGIFFVLIGASYTLMILDYAINTEESFRTKSEKLEHANRRLDLITKTDGLTGISNRRYFDEYYKREFRRAIREGSTMSIVMIDIDFFKNYNDSYGHIEGDFCLKEVALTLKTILHRPSDLVARYGGEEFVLVLPNTKDAVAIANKCVEEIRAMKIEHNRSSVSDVVTISAGVSTIKALNIEQQDELIKKADDALYTAKGSGRNQVIVSA